MSPTDQPYPYPHPPARSSGQQRPDEPKPGRTVRIAVVAVALVALLGIGIAVGWWLNRTPAAAPATTVPAPNAPTPTAAVPATTTPAPTSPPSTTPTPAPTPTEAQTVVVTHTVTERARPTERVTPKKPKPPAAEQQFLGFDTARFEHFTVELLAVEHEPAPVSGVQGIYARVCVNKTTDADQKTRISLDPWTFVDQDGRTRSPLRKGGYAPAFPAEGRYAVGECAAGWISHKAFPASEFGHVTVFYSNGVGEKASWNFH